MRDHLLRRFLRAHRAERAPVPRRPAFGATYLVFPGVLLLYVEAVTAQIVNKLLHRPTVRVKGAAARPDGAFYAAALRHLFALEDVA